MDSPKIKTVLIDADILMFRFAFRHQTEIDWGNGITSELLESNRAKVDIDQFIKSLLRKTGCQDYRLCFTHELNFRYSILPTYKANRSHMEPPKLLTILKKYMLDNHPYESWKYLEADDLMGILGTKYPDQYILSTIDKDFESLPVWLFNWDKDKKPRRISEERADYMFHYQWLIGDPGDGYYGCYRIGDKKARRILDEHESHEWSDAVIETYADRCYTWYEIIQQARMARILRHTDYDFKRKEVILWNPNC